MTNSSRDAATGQYDFGGDLNRICKCGHALGVHVAGGWDCLNGNKSVPGADGNPCDCEKFRAPRAALRKPAPEARAQDESRAPLPPGERYLNDSPSTHRDPATDDPAP